MEKLAVTVAETYPCAWHELLVAGELVSQTLNEKQKSIKVGLIHHIYVNKYHIYVWMCIIRLP